MDDVTENAAGRSQLLVGKTFRGRRCVSVGCGGNSGGWWRLITFYREKCRLHVLLMVALLALEKITCLFIGSPKIMTG